MHEDMGKSGISHQYVTVMQVTITGLPTETMGKGEQCFNLYCPVLIMHLQGQVSRSLVL